MSERDVFDGIPAPLHDAMLDRNSFGTIKLARDRRFVGNKDPNCDHQHLHLNDVRSLIAIYED